MNDTIIVFSGRTFCSEDIELIQWTRKKYPELKRREFIHTICEFFEWKTLAGKSKIPQCEEFLELLETKGLLTLPPKIKTAKRVTRFETIEYAEEISGRVEDYKIEVELVKPDENLLWRSYINQFHRLGDKRVFGTQLRYFIKTGNKELGCIQFSASAWALEERESWIGWTVEQRKKQLNLIVNNSRYLILPWVKIKNLASKALSLVAKRIQNDWLKMYCYSPVLLETFVDLTEFKGTCYKAANWINLGETKGRGRMDRYKEHPLSKKAIFMYPLQKDFKEILKGEKIYKVINIDEC
jgi:hypothetical protein